MRLVVTAVRENGRSYVASDADIPDAGLIWDADPRDTQKWIDAIDPSKALGMAQPKPGGLKWMLVKLPPGAGMAKADHGLDGMDEDGFHVTRTIDYIYVIDAGAVLRLDEGEVVLGSGNVVLQQATRHAWRNPCDHPVQFIAVLVSGETSTA